MSEDADFLYALELQNKWNREQSDDDIETVSKDAKFKVPGDLKKPIVAKRINPRSNFDEDFLNRTQNLVHPLWETLDPTPDVNGLFQAFDNKFFQGRLKCVNLEWSKRMYSCAGICYSRRNRYGMAITIRLSEPLLKLRPRKDLIETLLHEMIHAYCSVLGIREGNGGHGPNFKKIMQGINKVAGTNITVYHTFIDEVDVYKVHWWRCNGTCQHRSPFFGYVKRSSNRAPGPNDVWWASHHDSCGGTFLKIKGPEVNSKKNKENKPSVAASDLRKFFPKLPNKTDADDKIKGATKFNGGGTLLLNPKNKPPSTLTPTSLPPAHASDNNRTVFRNSSPSGGNLTNVVGLKDLDRASSSTSQSYCKSPSKHLSGKGYSLSNETSASTQTPPTNVDREHIRSIWTKRFSSNSNKGDEVSNDHNTKRRKICSQSPPTVVVDDDKRTESTWVTIDEEVMMKDFEKEVIDISSSDDEGSNEAIENNLPKRQEESEVTLTAEERQKAIKQEILDESLDDQDNIMTEEDIILIDAEFNDDEDLLNISELADTTLIDDLFGEDTLLKEFKRENDVVPCGSHSRFVCDPQKDIITCPICQNKMKREVLADHLDGCTGITVKIELPKFNKKTMKQIASTSAVLGPKKQKRPSPRTILLSAGYSEEDVSGISISSQGSSTAEEESNSPTSSEQLKRQRGLFSQTRPCPVCCADVDVEKINEHLDECLSN